MTKIFNGTPHNICIFAKEDTNYVSSQRKYILESDGSTPILVIPPSGVLLNAKNENAPAPTIDYGVPVVGAVQFTSYDNIPEGYELYIVSNLYRSAVQALGGDTSKLATVSDTVYTKEIKPVGCLALAVG
jgi:hypothetical protein